MKKVSKLCTMALAAVMAISFAAPINSKAAYPTIYDTGYETYYDIDESVEYKNNQDGSLTPTTKTVTYRNKVTGETCVKDARGNTISGDYDKATKSYEYGVPKKITIGTDEYVNYSIRLHEGEKLKSFKVKSGKGCVSIKKAGMSSSDTSGYSYYYNKPDYDMENYGFDSRYAPSETKTYSYVYRLGGRSVGTSVLEIKIKDGVGAIKTLDIKVTVTNDNRVFKSLTYAGKNLLLDLNKDATNKKLLYAQTKNKSGIYYTKKKSGKFKVKMGDNYKFVAAYVVKPNAYKTETDTRKYNSYTSTRTYLEREYSRGIDLNGDGDYEDTINGIRENNFSGCNVKKIGKSAKITLNTIPTQTNTTSYNTDNKTGEVSNYSSSYNNDNIAHTMIIIAYQDKMTKSFSTAMVPVFLRVGK